MATTRLLGSKSEAFHLDGQTWICNKELASDLVIEIGDISFHLHKFPLLNRSGLLQRLISESQDEDGKTCHLQLHDIPGGAKAFELVAKFCYEVKIELTALNIVSLRCAAEFLRMTEDYVGGNLISETESFLNEVFGHWKDSMKALETCEDVLPYAEELHIVTRCINSLASKTCADPSLFGWPLAGCSTSSESPGGSVMWNGIGTTENQRSPRADWWFEDVSFLNLSLYKRLILAIKTKGIKPDIVAGSLMYYANKHLAGLSRHSSFHDGSNRIMTPGSTVSTPSENDQRILLEKIVGLLPTEKGVIPTGFLLSMLHTSMVLHASPSCRESLEKRVGVQLDEAVVEDLLIPNIGYPAESLYDIDCVQRILDNFVLVNQPTLETSTGIVDEGQLMASSLLTPLTMVAKLIDGYLAEVAPDVNLKFPKFQSLAAVIPDYARPSYDGIYRAIDIYLQSHPWLTDTEREQLCRLMNCQKLSLEGSTHAAQNERLPLRVIVQVLFFEQLRLRTTISGWFFVSDNIDNSHGPSGSLVLQKNNNGPIQANISQKLEGDLVASIDDVKSRVSELEKDWSSMKQEIDKLGKPKGTWKIFHRLFGFGLRSQCGQGKKNGY